MATTTGSIEAQPLGRALHESKPHEKAVHNLVAMAHSAVHEDVIKHEALAAETIGPRISKLVGPNLTYSSEDQKVVPVDHFSFLNPPSHLSPSGIQEWFHKTVTGIFGRLDQIKEKHQPHNGGNVWNIPEELGKDFKCIRDIIPWVDIELVFGDPVKDANHFDAMARNGNVSEAADTTLRRSVENAINYIADAEQQRPPKKLGLFMTFFAETPLGRKYVDFRSRWRTLSEYGQNYGETMPLLFSDTLDKTNIPSPFINEQSQQRADRLHRIVFYTAFFDNMYTALVKNAADQTPQAEAARKYYYSLLSRTIGDKTNTHSLVKFQEGLRKLTEIVTTASSADTTKRSGRRAVNKAEESFKKDQFDARNRLVMGLQLLACVDASVQAVQSQHTPHNKFF